MEIHGRPRNHKAHIDRFYASVLDESLVKVLSVMEMTDVTDLERALKSQARSTRRYEVVRERDNKPKVKDPFKGRDFKEHSKSKPEVSQPPAPRVKKVHWSPAPTSRSDPSSGDDDGGPSGQDLASSEGEPTSSSEEQYEARQISVVQEVPDPRPRSFENRERTPCATCGSKLHHEASCWKNIECQRCGKVGHPSDRCKEVCKACDKVHEKGACQYEDFFNKISAWYNPTRHAGLLPPDVEKALN